MLSVHIRDFWFKETYLKKMACQLRIFIETLRPCMMGKELHLKLQVLTSCMTLGNLLTLRLIFLISRMKTSQGLQFLFSCVSGSNELKEKISKHHTKLQLLLHFTLFINCWFYLSQRIQLFF
jgi:hypothetical protein